MRSIWVIYCKPTDYPADWVMREHVMEHGEVQPTENFITAATLKELRAQVPAGAVRMPRSPQDEPQIVEWYIGDV